jgi:transposase InsO family protein
MQIRMQDPGNWNTDQIKQFLEGGQEIDFQSQNQAERYEWIGKTLVAQQYASRNRREKGLVRAMLGKMTGLSVPQITRLIRQYRQHGKVARKPVRRRRFATKYTAADVALLAEVDRVHQRLSGPATRRILEREFQIFSRKKFQRLAGLSVSHLYNLRAGAAYRRQATQFTPTQSVRIAIGERRRPDPGGQPGYLRVDTVHQGDWEGEKGIYHLNSVDAVTQWEIIGCTAKISESYLLPVLEAVLHQFPFRILGFHADNGSEYINHRVAQMLNKLLAEFTKSRPYKSQDNALVEGKNGAVIRKHIGWGHIRAEHGEAVQKFYTAHFNPYLNYHRPCGFATVTTAANGKRKRTYKTADYATPYEKLKSLPHAEQYLKPGLSFTQLDRIAQALSDTECAEKMHRAKAQLLRRVKIEAPFPPPC